MINFRLLDNSFIDDSTPTAYRDFLYDIIQKTEAIEPATYLDSSNIPSIGIGFNLTDENIRDLVLDKFGVADGGDRLVMAGIVNQSYTSNTVLQTALNVKMAELAGAGRANRSTFAFTAGAVGVEEMRSVFNVAVKIYDQGYPDANNLTDENGRVDAWLAGIPTSKERAVLVSLSYNGVITAGTSPSLRQAILSGDRAEAWFEIRYNSNRLGNLVARGSTLNATDQDKYDQGEDRGLAKRRYYESETFGLYDEGSLTPAQLDAEAKSVLQMYTRHRENILKYEATYGVQPDGSDGSRGNMVTQGESAYSTSIDTLSESLDSARIRLIAAEVTAHGITRTIDGEVLIGQDLDYVTPKQTYSKDDTTTLVGKDKNDLILGGAGDDRLDGGLGDDILIGGAGVDTYVVQGHDILIDSGRNLILYNGALIAGVFTGDGSGSTFTDDKGNTLVFHSPGNLSLGATDSITFQNQMGAAAFAGHDFGLFLREPSLAPATTATQVGDSDNNNLSGTAVNDLIVGNGGRDLLQGESGDDVLFADAQVVLPAGPGFGGTTPYADAVGDFVNGGVGADTLIGGALSDALVGAEGDDLRWAA